MHNSRIEDIVKQKLQGHQEDIDKNELWASLGIEPERKKKRAAWWMWGSALLVLVMAAYIGFGTMSNQSKQLSKSPVAAAAKTSDEASEGSTLGGELSATQVINQTTSDTKDQEVTNKGNATEKNNQEQKGKRTTNITSNIPAATVANVNDSSTDVEVQNIVAVVNDNIGQQPKTTIENLEENRTAKGAAIASEKTLQRRDSEATPLEQKQILLASEPRAMVVSKVDVPSAMVTVHQHVGEWAAYAEYGAVSRSLSSIRAADEEVAVRNSSESVTDYLAAGIQYHHRAGKNLSVFAGLRYTQINEVMTYADIVTQAVQADAITVYTDINGVSSTSTTTGEGLEILEKRWTYQNQMKVLSIPVGLLYERRFGKWGIDIEAGIALRLASRFSGEILTVDGLIESSPQYLNTGLGYEWSVGLFGRYQLAENSCLSFGPSYRQHARGFTTGANGMQQTYSTVGGRLSFVTRF